MKIFCKHNWKYLMKHENLDVFKCEKCGKYQYFNKHINAMFVSKNAPHIRIPDKGIGSLSDGYHTFNELYHHRAILFSVICYQNRDISWKSKKHSDGTMYDNMFIVGINTPQGQATYHYDINPYWNLFDVKELQHAPKWDGHTSDDVIERLCNLTLWRKNENKQSQTKR